MNQQPHKLVIHGTEDFIDMMVVALGNDIDIELMKTLGRGHDMKEFIDTCFVPGLHAIVIDSTISSQIRSIFATQQVPLYVCTIDDEAGNPIQDQLTGDHIHHYTQADISTMISAIQTQLVQRD